MEKVKKSKIKVWNMYLDTIGIEMVFCFKNCYDLAWEKIVLFIERKTFEIRELDSFLRWLEQFSQVNKKHLNTNSKK